MPSIFDQLTARPKTDEPLADGVEPQAEGLASGSAALTEGAPAQEEGYTPRQLKAAVLELLKYGSLEAQRKANLYRTILAQRQAVVRILEPLDFLLKIDEVRGLAYLAIAGQAFDEEQDDWSHPLVRRHRFNLEQSLLIAILRQQFAAYEQQAAVGAGEALIAIEDLLPQLKLYLGDLGSDAQEEKRLRNLLDLLKSHGIVSEIDEHERVVIRPIIAHLANPENLASLLHALHQAPQRDPPEAATPAQGSADGR